MKLSHSCSSRLSLKAQSVAIAASLLSGLGASAENIAPEGTGISGVHRDGEELTTPGIPWAHVNPASILNDGSTSAILDTWAGGGGEVGIQTSGYLGVTWPAPRTDGVQSLALSMATFVDGGWFGVNGLRPEDGGALVLGTHISGTTEPVVQVTSNGGSSWSAVGASSDYLTVMAGHTIGGGGNPNPSIPGKITFILTTPATGIDGIRVIGTVGGNAGAQPNGFIAASELVVEAAPVDDADGDGLPDVWETRHDVDDPAGDEEPDGLTNLQEFEHGTDPNDDDSDDDGLTDGAEVNTHLTNPTRADSDGDGLSDGDEVNIHQTNPNLIDTDGDGFSDGIEVEQASDPNNSASMPDNAALSGSAFLGRHNEADDLTTLGTLFANHGNGVVPSGISVRLNDGITAPEALLSIADTFHGGAPDSHSQIGVLWEIPPARPIDTVTVTVTTFYDGGWFGINGVSPDPNSPLVLDTHFSEATLPTVQVSRDDGVTWMNIPSTTDLLTVLNGHLVGNPPTAVDVIWTLDSPVRDISGIRIIGTHGGNAGPASLGFFAATEIAITNNGAAGGFRITGIDFVPPPAGEGNQGEFTLTWTSIPGRSYTLYYSKDLTSLGADGPDLGDNFQAGPGETTTVTFPHPVPDAAKLFFAVALNPN